MGPPERIVEKAPGKVEEDTPFERTEEITNPERTFAVSALLAQNARKGVDTILEAGMPRVVMDAEPYVKLIADMATRGLKLRCITEITRENIDACKQYDRYFEVRHLDGVRANFSVSDTDTSARRQTLKITFLTQCTATRGVLSGKTVTSLRLCGVGRPGQKRGTGKSRKVPYAERRESSTDLKTRCER